jgi:hypothetical protein
MTWTLVDKEVRAVLLLDGAKRYAYCIKRVADEQQLWSLRQEDGWVLAGDGAGRELVPVWPHQEFAIRCATGIWRGHQPAPIELDAWLQRWIPGIERDGRLIAVFPIPGDRGVAIDPRRFETDLREKLSQYE